MPLNPPLTAADVRSEQFGTTRWWKCQTGYSEGEVDAFLDRVEVALRDLADENAALRGGRPEQVWPAPEPPLAAPGPDQPEPGYQPRALAVGPPPAQDEIAAAADVLAMARQTAAQVVAAARQRADELVSRARAEAEQISGDARALAARLQRGLEEQREEALGSLTGQRDALERQIGELQAIEREHRARLRAYLDEPSPSPLDAGAGDPGESTLRFEVPDPVADASPGSASPNGGPTAGHGVRGGPGGQGPAGPAAPADQDPGSARRGRGAREPESDRDPGAGPPGAEARSAG